MGKCMEGHISEKWTKIFRHIQPKVHRKNHDSTVGKSLIFESSGDGKEEAYILGKSDDKEQTSVPAKTDGSECAATEESSPSKSPNMHVETVGTDDSAVGTTQNSDGKTLEAPQHSAKQRSVGGQKKGGS